MKFEEASKRLNEIVRKLERGELSLDESLAAFEEGAKLIRLCNEMLDKAEQKITLLKENGEEVPFEIENNGI